MPKSRPTLEAYQEAEQGFRDAKAKLLVAMSHCLRDINRSPRLTTAVLQSGEQIAMMLDGFVQYCKKKQQRLRRKR